MLSSRNLLNHPSHRSIPLSDHNPTYHTFMPNYRHSSITSNSWLPNTTDQRCRCHRDHQISFSQVFHAKIHSRILGYVLPSATIPPSSLTGYSPAKYHSFCFYQFPFALFAQTFTLHSASVCTRISCCLYSPRSCPLCPWAPHTRVTLYAHGRTSIVRPWAQDSLFLPTACPRAQTIPTIVYGFSLT